MEYSDEFLKKVSSLGMLGYSMSKIINVLDVEDEAQFELDFNDKKHPVHRAYQKGKDKADFQIDKKLFDLAISGDMKALTKYEERRDFEAAKEKLRKYPNK